MTSLEALTSYNSYKYHKCEIPAENLLPPAPKDVAELVQQIEGLLSALCYRVEDYLNLPDEEQLSGVNPAAWSFFHEVIALLPRDLDPESINEALYVFNAIVDIHAPHTLHIQTCFACTLAEVSQPVSHRTIYTIYSQTLQPLPTDARRADEPRHRCSSARCRKTLGYNGPRQHQRQSRR